MKTFSILCAMNMTLLAGHEKSLAPEHSSPTYQHVQKVPLLFQTPPRIYRCDSHPKLKRVKSTKDLTELPEKTNTYTRHQKKKIKS